MDEREIEAVAYVLHEAPPEADLANVARECIAALARVRDARGDDEAPGRDGDKLYCLCDHSRTYCPHTEGQCPWWDREPVNARWTAVQASPDALDALRAAAKRVLEADMRGVRDLDALNALEDAAGFSQQGQDRRALRSTQSEGHEDCPDCWEGRPKWAGTMPAPPCPTCDGTGKRSPQGEGHEAGIPEAALDAAEAAVHASRRYALGHPSRKAIYVEARDEAYDVLTAAMPHLSRVSPSRDARGDDEHDDETEWKLLVRLERDGLFRDGMTATDARSWLDG